MFTFMKNYPSTYQRETYERLAKQITDAGFKPYEVTEENYDAYKCVNEKNTKLLFKINDKRRRQGD